MALSDREQQQLAAAAIGLTPTAPTETFYNFATRALGWASPLVAATRLSIDLQDIIAGLTRTRQDLLNEESVLPNFVVHQDQRATQYLISGLVTFASQQDPHQWTARLVSKDDVRARLCQFKDNHQLEAVAAALLSIDASVAFATAGSHDQGVDAASWRDILALPEWVGGGYLVPPPGAKLFSVASSKATVTKNGLRPRILDPKYVRELVGSWVIQRHSAGYWSSELGIRMLSPVQTVLVTTYRLSEESWALCHKLGVLVWSLPQLTYMICRYVPQAFDPVTAKFNMVEFDTWWKRFDQSRVAPRIV